ncbi:MAG: tetratricopeptide repeat protein [Pseudonocardiaceae bacterium]
MNQAHPVEPGGSFLGIAVGGYQHHQALPCAVPRVRELAATLDGSGYRPTVLENPTTDQLRTGLREWRRRPVDAQSPVVLAWSGHATAVGDVLRLAARDASATFEPDGSYRPESLVENALGSGADQILVLIDTVRADQDAQAAVCAALDGWANRTFPPGETGWLGVLASCRTEDGDTGGSLLDAAGRLLRHGPSSGSYRRAWSVQNAGITGRELVQTLLDELAGAEQRPVHVESGTAQVMFRNPRWRPEEPPRLVEHLVSASRGAAPQEEGWFFTGRRAVLRRIMTWMHGEAPGTFVVTGSAGCGKSAVVGRIAALSDPTERRALLEHAPLAPEDPDPYAGAVDAAVHLRGMGPQDLATALADRLDLPVPENRWKLIAEVAAMPYRPVLVLDGLDEAVPEQLSEIVTDLLVPLGAVARVLLATRYGEFGLRRPVAGEPSSVRLRELFGRAAPVVDLDAEAGTRDDIERYVTSRLRSAGRGDIAERVAPALASRAAAEQGGFLYARIVAAQIARQAFDVSAEGWEQQLPATVSGALDHDLDSGVALVRDGAELPVAARDLLRALAWGLGRGMPAGGVWEAAATALSPDGVEYRTADLDWVLEHYGHYIVEDGEGGEAVYRLYHQELVEHLVGSSPAVAGRPAAQALAEALVALTEVQHGDPDRHSPYLRLYLARHASLAGAPGAVALRRLADGNPEAYLPDLAMWLNKVTAHLARVGEGQAALAAAQQTADTYQVLAEANPRAYVPDLAMSLHNLAAQLAEMGQHQAALDPVERAADIYQVLAEDDPEAYVPNLARSLNNLAVYLSEVGPRQAALVPARHAADMYRVLTELDPTVYLTDLVTSLNNLAVHLAALDRISDAVDAYTTCIDTFAATPGTRDPLIIERAGFHVSHGDAPTGLRELATLLTSDGTGTPEAIVLAARNALRGHRAQHPLAVDRAWRAVSGSEPPEWLALTAEQICIVVEWIVAPTWAESKRFFAAHAEELLAHPAAVALDELELLVAPRAGQHRYLLDDVRERGIEAAYRPLLLKDLLTDWISAENWQDSRSFAEEHATDLLTTEAEVMLARLGHPTEILVHLAVLRFARREGFGAAYACVTDRRLAADRMQRALAEAECDPIAEVAAFEGQIFGERFTSAVHFVVAASLTGEAMTDTSKLTELAAQADLADLQRVTAEITELIGRVPEHAELLGALTGALLQPHPT